jgi:hypothetical protein
MKALRVFAITAFTVLSLYHVAEAKSTYRVYVPVQQDPPKPPPPPPNPFDLFKKKKKDSTKGSKKDTVAPALKDTAKKKKGFRFPKLPRPGDRPPGPPGSR